MADRFPRQAMFDFCPGRVFKVRVIEYLGDGKFKIVDHQDAYRVVHRSRLTFLGPQRARTRANDRMAGESTPHVVTVPQRRAQPLVAQQLRLW